MQVNEFDGLDGTSFIFLDSNKKLQRSPNGDRTAIMT